MIVFHTAWLESRLFLWGEVPEEESPATKRRRGKRPATTVTDLLPFDAGTERMISVLDAASPGLGYDKGRVRTMAVWMPTRAGKPVPSGPLISEAHGHNSETTLTPWSVTALPLTPEEAIAFLCDCRDRRTLGPGIVAGKDPAFFAQALRFAGELVARQKFLPALRERDGRYRACWEPLFTGPDAAFLSALAGRMPGVARALSAPVAVDAFRTRGGSDVRESVLSSLGQAAGLCGRTASSLRAAEPHGFELDAAGAHEFLSGTSLMLEQAGFGVMLPSWWTGRGTKARLSVRAHVKSPAMRASAGLGLDAIAAFDWEAALGEEKLSTEELQALADLKSPLVRLRGQWVEVSARDIEAALSFCRKTPGTASVREIVRMALGSRDAEAGLPLAGVQADGWVGELLDRLAGGAAFEEIPPPRGFAGTLRPYQARGYSWLRFLTQWGLGACLADDMGLGKTIQALALVQHCRESGAPGPVFLACPTSVVNNWKKEAARFTPGLAVMIHHGTGRKTGAAFAKEAEKQALVISSYALMHRDVEHLRQVSWSGVILDEAQNIKNPETRQARAARALSAGYRVALTGTPIENNVGDLWSIMEFLNPGSLGSQGAFRRSFFVPIQTGRDPEAPERLKRAVGPFILRRLKTDKAIASDLPDKMEMKVFCNLTKEQASLYAAVLRDVEEALEGAMGIQRKGLILATLSKLKQVCNHPAHFLGDNSRIPDRSGKLARLTEMLEVILEAGERALVFSQFAEMGGIMKRHIQETFGREVLFLHGGVPKGQRDRMVDRFQSEGDGPPVFILSLKAGGTGLNLTRASHVFHFDRWWNPAVENQATDRAFRIGQTRNVQVHKFLCAGTLEEKIDEMIERKKEIAGKIVGAGEGWLTELSNAALKDLMALRREAVCE
jgi:hypothetical protein